MRVVVAFLLAGCSASIVPSDGGAMALVDVVGTWHDCNASVTYRADGTSHVVLHRLGCEAEGAWRLDGEWLEASYTPGPCGDAAEVTARRVSRAARGLVLVEPETGQTWHLADDATPHGLWRIEGDDGTGDRSTTASVVGDPEDTFGSGCYWSTDGACGGLFSCSGTVEVWSVEADRFSASTSCSGGCPCGSVIEGGVAGDGSLFGAFRGVNCERSFEGDLTARALP